MCFYKQAILRVKTRYLELAMTRRITVGLPRKGDNIYLEDFISMTVLTSLVNKKKPNKKSFYQERLEKELEQKMKEIEENPGDYFNFGFNLQDFKQFLLKILISRATRAYIDQQRIQAANKAIQYFQIDLNKILPPSKQDSKEDQKEDSREQQKEEEEDMDQE